MNVVILGSLENVRQEMIIVPVSGAPVIEGRGFVEIVSKHRTISEEYFSKCRSGVLAGDVQFIDTDDQVIALACVLRIGNDEQNAIQSCADKIKARIDGSEIKSVVVYCDQSIMEFCLTIVDLLERTLDKCHVDVWM